MKSDVRWMPVDKDRAREKCIAFISIKDRNCNAAFFVRPHDTAVELLISICSCPPCKSSACSCSSASVAPLSIPYLHSADPQIRRSGFRTDDSDWIRYRTVSAISITSLNPFMAQECANGMDRDTATQSLRDRWNSPEIRSAESLKELRLPNQQL